MQAKTLDQSTESSKFCKGNFSTSVTSPDQFWLQWGTKVFDSDLALSILIPQLHTHNVGPMCPAQYFSHVNVVFWGDKG